MKNLTSIFLCILLLLVPIKSLAQETEIADSFEPLYVEVLQGGKLYSGVLLSELEYDRYILVEKDLLHAEQKLKILEESNEKYDQLLSKWDSSVDILKKDLLKIDKELQKPVSIWEEYDFEFGLGIGIVTTILTIFLVKNI